MPSSHEPPTGGKAEIRPLRLVHPAPPKPPREKRKRVPTFTAEEQARLRAALKNARPLLGTWARLAAAMRVAMHSIQDAAGGSRPVTAEMALRLARALGKPLESLYRAPAAADVCPTCGAKRGAP